MFMRHALAGATLEDWQFSFCFVRRADFAEARFHGLARFARVQFHDLVDFTRAEFHDTASFTEAWAQLDYESPGKSRWPSGWTVRKDDPGEGREGRWGQFVPDEEQSAAGKAMVVSSPSSNEVGE